MEAAALEKDWVLGSENAVNVHRKWAWVREKTHEYASEKEDSRINQRSFGKMRATERVAPTTSERMYISQVQCGLGGGGLRAARSTGKDGSCACI